MKVPNDTSSMMKNWGSRMSYGIFNYEIFYAVKDYYVARTICGDTDIGK